jgi:hypothetical protein
MLLLKMLLAEPEQELAFATNSCFTLPTLTYLLEVITVCFVLFLTVVGVGESGLGQYHGKLTFDAFVHRKAVVKSTTIGWLDLPFRYPPFTKAVVCN